MTGALFDPDARNEGFDTPETRTLHEESQKREFERLRVQLDELESGLPPLLDYRGEPIPEPPPLPGEVSKDRVADLEGMWTESAATSKLGALMARYGVVRASDIDAGATSPPPLIDGFFAPDELTLLYGDSGTGKGMLAAWMVARATQREERVVILDFEGHQGEWRRRLGWFGADLTQVLIWEPIRAAARNPEVPLLSLADREDVTVMREVVQAFGADIVVIDSVVSALGASDVMGPEAARLLSFAAQTFDTATLAISHVSKSDAEEGLKGHAYGSTFFRAFTRLQWGVDPRVSGGSLSHGGLFIVPTKGNEYPDLPTFRLDVVGCLEDGDLDLRLVPFEGSRKPKGRKALDEAWAHIPTEAPGRTAKEVFESLVETDPKTWVKYDSLQKALGRAVDEGRIKDNGAGQRDRRFYRHS